MVVKQVLLSTLVGASYNPLTRTRGLNKLQASIEKVGLLQPILIDSQNGIVEGHRRVAACLALGWEKIPALIVAGDPAEIYAHANGFSKKHSGNETLQVWLRQPSAVTPVTASKLEAAEEALGRPLLLRMAKKGRSITTYKLACQLMARMDASTPANLRTVVRWCLSHGTDSLSKAMAAGTSTATLWKAIRQNKDLRTSFHIK